MSLNERQLDAIMELELAELDYEPALSRLNKAKREHKEAFEEARALRESPHAPGCGMTGWPADALSCECGAVRR